MNIFTNDQFALAKAAKVRNLKKICLAHNKLIKSLEGLSLKSCGLTDSCPPYPPSFPPYPPNPCPYWAIARGTKANNKI